MDSICLNHCCGAKFRNWHPIVDDFLDCLHILIHTWGIQWRLLLMWIHFIAWRFVRRHSAFILYIQCGSAIQNARHVLIPAVNRARYEPRSRFPWLYFASKKTKRKIRGKRMNVLRFSPRKNTESLMFHCTLVCGQDSGPPF